MPGSDAARSSSLSASAPQGSGTTRRIRFISYEHRHGSAGCMLDRVGRPITSEPELISNAV
eukprot:2289972-Rhodomonas_salina.2